MVTAESVDPAVAEISHVNVNDGSVEGLRVQAPQLLHRPVPSRRPPPGPMDTEYLFDRFVDYMKGGDAVMPKNPNIKKVLVLGSGPIVIGQAAEFDYAGTQACRALKEEGIEVVLVNSNPATIMTDKDIADHVYIEPLNIATVTQVIEKERPDSILPTLGGQTGLNLAMDLHEDGILEKYGVKLLGTSPESIRKAEDRQGFKDCHGGHRPALRHLRGGGERGGRRGLRREDRLPGHRPPRLHPGRHRRRHRLRRGLPARRSPTGAST